MPEKNDDTIISNGKSDFEKMTCGEEYDFGSEELVAITKETEKKRHFYNNHAHELSNEERFAAFSTIFKSVGKGTTCRTPINTNYGVNTTIGDNCFFNFNCTLLDCAPITIGNDCLIGPNVQIYTVGHPSNSLSNVMSSRSSYKAKSI